MPLPDDCDPIQDMKHARETAAVRAERRPAPDGGPAFPRPTSDTPGQVGMSLRDFFAAHALSGVLAFTTGDSEGCQQMEPKQAAREAYAMADAMLAERARPAA